MDDKQPVDELENFKPTGTLVLLAIYLVTIIALWTSVYLILLARGVTM